MSDQTRTERDSFGPIEVPIDGLWGAQTQRSLQNFEIGDHRFGHAARSGGLAVGDADFREKSMRRVEDLVNDEDTTVVVVSHSQGELRRMCSRMVLLERGELIYEGGVEDALNEYKTITKAGAPVRAKK